MQVVVVGHTVVSHPKHIPDIMKILRDNEERALVCYCKYALLFEIRLCTFCSIIYLFDA